MVAFASLKVGDKFVSDGQTWVKVTPKKKSCCTILYNATLDETPSTTKIFRPSDQVQKL